MSSPATTARPASGPGGVIHDIGYQRYAGPRLGRAYARRSLFVHSLRTAYALGRSGVAKIFPGGILLVLVSIAAILVAVQSQVPPEVTERVFTYWQFPTQTNTLVLLFCAVAAPELVSRDLRGGVLPLYFSRPLSRSDYPLAKYAALATAVFLLEFIPLLALFLGSAFSQESMGAVADEFGLFLQGVVVAALTAVLFSAIALLIASLSGRRAVAAALIVGAFILTTPVLAVLQALAWANVTFDGQLTGAGQQLFQLSFLVSPFTIVEGIGGWLFDTDEPMVGPYGPLYLVVTLAIIATCLLLTLVRYRKVAR
jgi:ABC-2 type transport system permease protein